MGLPHDVAGQRRILVDGLEAAAALTEPGTIVDLPIRYVDDDWKAAPMSWSRRRQNSGGIRPAASTGGDSRTDRSDEPVYQTPEDAAAAAEVDWDDQCRVCIGLPE